MKPSFLLVLDGGNAGIKMVVYRLRKSKNSDQQLPCKDGEEGAFF